LEAVTLIQLKSVVDGHYHALPRNLWLLHRHQPELQTALEPLMAAIASVSEQIGGYNERIETLAHQSYPQVTLLKQVKGGTLIALKFLLTLEDPHRFGKSRDVGCYLSGFVGIQ